MCEGRRTFQRFGGDDAVGPLHCPEASEISLCVRGIFVGYEDRQQVGYRIYLPEQKHFIVNYRVTFSNADDIFSSIKQANLNDRQVNSLMKSMSHEIKEDPHEPSSTPKENQVDQSTGHAYLSALYIAQEDIMLLSHRLQSDSQVSVV